MTGTATSQMAVLQAIPSSGVIALDDLSTKVTIERRFVVNTVGRLIMRGYVARSERGVYKLTKAGAQFIESGEELKSGSPAKRTGCRLSHSGSLRQRLWNAMRQKAGASFSLPDLLLVALNFDEDPVLANNNAEKYIRRLKKTGYLLTINRRQSGTRPGSNGFLLYKLNRDLGDRAPVVREGRGVVFDPNTHEVFPW